MGTAIEFKRNLVFGSTALVASLFIATSGAHAATLNVVGGQLLGASGVDVGGTLYDVEFLDGTCIALFGGCDELSDFSFTSMAAATQASQALLDQVFIDGTGGNFDTQPSLTNGCANPSSCYAITPYGLIPVSHAAIGTALNLVGVDSASNDVYPIPVDTTSDPGVVYASWSVVPEPGTGILLALGLFGLAARHRSAP